MPKLRIPSVRSDGNHKKDVVPLPNPSKIWQFSNLFCPWG